MTIDRTFQGAFFVLSFLLLFYKAYIFSYVAGYFVVEILGICALLGLQITRLYIGSKGNKTESSIIMVLFLGCTAASCAVNIYYLQFQTYVLLIDIIIGLASLVAGGLEFLFACFAAIEFKSLENSQ